jgi:hypothetical protein
MAKKRLKKHVKNEIRSASKSFSSFLVKGVETIREEICHCFCKNIKFDKKDKIEKFGFEYIRFLWPIISSFFGLFFIMLGVLALNTLNIKLGNYFIASLAVFFYQNAYTFFALSLFFGYADYIKKKLTDVYWVIEPVINSMIVVAFVWVVLMILSLANPHGSKNILLIFYNALYLNLEKIFVFFILLGYVVALFKIILKGASKK